MKTFHILRPYAKVKSQKPKPKNKKGFRRITNYSQSLEGKQEFNFGAYKEIRLLAHYYTILQR